MTEAEILNQIQMGRYNIGFMASQMIAVTFALVAAIFYFLHKASFVLKLAAHFLYSVGYGSLLSLYVWEVRHMAALEVSLEDLSTDKTLSMVGQQMMADFAVMDLVQSIGPWIIIGGSWLMVTILLFFPQVWRRHV